MIGINEIREFHNLLGWSGAGADETSKAVWRFASHRSPRGAHAWSAVAKRSGDTALDSLRRKGAGADETSKAVWRFASHRSPKGRPCMDCGGRAQRRHRFGFFAKARGRG
jgi:hypothetical protein